MNQAAIEVPPEASKPEVQKITANALSVVDKFSTYQVTTAEEYAAGAEHLKQIKSALNEVTDQRMAITRPMDVAKNQVMRFFGQFSDKLETAEAHVKRAMVTYQDEEDRKAREAARIARERQEREAARLREEARKADEAAAAKERARLAEEQRKADERAQIENDRIAQEKALAQEAADEDAMRRAQEQEEAARVRRDKEQERIHKERLAAEADARERSARAETLEARADSSVTAPLAPATPKIKGVSTPKVWDFEITDASKVPDQYKTIDEKKIRGVVKALKADANIPGVRVYQKTQIRSTSR